LSAAIGIWPQLHANNRFPASADRLRLALRDVD
jgi:hypothetical protein